MRNYINIIESYNDETHSQAIRLTSDQIDLFKDMIDFQKEDWQLSQYFKAPLSIRKLITTYTKQSSVNDQIVNNRISIQNQNLYRGLLRLRGIELKEGHHVYSGTGSFDPTNLIKRGIFSTETFISASLNIRCAIKVSNFKRRDDHDAILHFNLPPRFSDGFYLGHYSTSPEEFEYLILPNTKFKLIDKSELHIDDVVRTVYGFEPIRE